MDSTVAGSLLRTLPGRYYTDPEVFARERRTIFEQMWICVIRSEEIAGPGAFRVARVGDESVLIVRGKDKELRAFLNVCRHRGARLCAAESGQVRRNLRCGYHAWTYDLDGRLVAAPNLANMADIDREAHGLIGVGLREWLGYVWVCVAGEPPSFEGSVMANVTGRLGDPTAIDRYRAQDLLVGRRISYDVRANWKLIVENFMECYHCATIHPDLVPDHVIAHRMFPLAADRTTVVCDWLFDASVIESGQDVSPSVESWVLIRSCALSY